MTGRYSRVVVAALVALSVRVTAQSANDFNDSHFHLTNYIQRGPDVTTFLKIMGTRVGRSTLFGIPLQQKWTYGNSGDYAPTYYLETDAPLYYYSFTDAVIAMQYRSLPKDAQARFDPMITGLQSRRTCTRRITFAACSRPFPGVFSGHRRIHDPQGVRLVEGRGRRRRA